MKWVELPDSVTCIAVSKKQSIECINQAWSLGYRHFGESYVQEALPKINKLPQATWHFIGRIQSNKIKEIAAYFNVVHSLASPAHAKKLELACAAFHKKMGVFIQVNFDRELQKNGLAPEELPAMIKAMESLSHLTLKGLMLIPKLDETYEEREEDFKRLKALLTQYQSPVTLEFQCLSMGMSQDYPLAIQHGATHVRLGTAIFGPRV